MSKLQAGVHTPGRLVVRVRQQGTSTYADLRRADDLEPDQRGERAVGTAESNDARRLAVCWNSFVGVSTEDIEAMGGVARFNGKPVGELAAVSADLEVSQSACAGMSNGIRTLMSSFEATQEDLASARALLASVVGHGARVTADDVASYCARIRVFLEATQ